MATKKVGLYRNRGNWSVRWFSDPDPKTGKSVRQGKEFRLKRDAERFRAVKQAEFDAGARRDVPQKISLAEFGSVYMERRNHEWREKTRISVQGVVERLIARFGRECQLTTITPTMAARFWSELSSLRSHSEAKELSAFTRNRILRDARTIFKYAVTWNHVIANPFDGGLEAGDVTSFLELPLKIGPDLVEPVLMSLLLGLLLFATNSVSLFRKVDFSWDIDWAILLAQLVLSLILGTVASFGLRKPL